MDTFPTFHEFANQGVRTISQDLSIDNIFAQRHQRIQEIGWGSMRGYSATNTHNNHSLEEQNIFRLKLVKLSL